MAHLKSVCIYCGSSDGLTPVYEQAAIELGMLMAEDNVRLVYGGGAIGLMGAVAKSVLAAGGQVTGIIPQFLAKREVMLSGASELIVTEDMHERKRLMFERAEAFVALPGGIGTLEELVEILTWAQLGRHVKPILIANINGFWNPLLTLLKHMNDQGFIHTPYDVNFLTADHPEQILPRLRDAVANLRQDEVDQTADHAAIRRL